MPRPSSKRPQIISNKKLYAMMAGAIVIALIFTVWAFHREPSSATLDNSSTASLQDVENSSHTNSGETNTAQFNTAPPSTPIQAPRIPTQAEMASAMMPSAKAHNLNLTSVQLIQCEPRVNALALNPVGEAYCKVQIVISKQGGPAKKLERVIHVRQDQQGQWQTLSR